MLEAALSYAAQGRRVHPCRPSDKTPYLKWGTAASSDLHVVRAWFENIYPLALIGLCTGDGLVVVDVDPRHGGEFDPELATTLTAQTPGGGWHHYFYSDEPIGCRVGLLPGIDVRGAGGYVIAVGSPGYKWFNDNKVLVLPPAICAAMRGGNRSPDKYGPSFEPADSVAEGGRNDYMARFVGWSIRAFESDEAEVIALALEHNEQVCVPPLPEAEVIRTARSIIRRHERA